MYTQTEAEHFVRNLLEDVFPMGKVELLPEFYLPCSVEHRYDKKLTFDEIRNKAIHEQTQKTQFKVKEVNTFADFIFCFGHEIKKNENKVAKASRLWVYRMKDKKINEAWLMTDDSLHLNQTDSANGISDKMSCNFATHMLQ